MQAPRTTQVPKKKKPVPPQRSTHSNAQAADDRSLPKPTHHWKGGGADRDIIDAGLLAMQIGTRRRSRDSTGSAGYAASQAATKNAANTNKRAYALEAKPDEVVVRSGKGWQEFAPKDNL